MNDYRKFETDQRCFTRDAKSCLSTCNELFPTFREKDYKIQPIEHFLQNQPNEHEQQVRVFDFLFSDITDEEMNCLINIFIILQDVYSQHILNAGKTRQKFLITLKPNVELKRQRPSEVPLHSKEKLEKLLTQLKDSDIIWEMGSLFVNPIILVSKKGYVKLVLEFGHKAH